MTTVLLQSILRKLIFESYLLCGFSRICDNIRMCSWLDIRWIVLGTEAQARAGLHGFVVYRKALWYDLLRWVVAY